MKDSNFRKYGDKLLFALALAVLAAALIRAGGAKTITRVTAPHIVFTHWWQDDLGDDVLAGLVKEFESLHDGIKITLNPKSYEDTRNELFNSGGAEAASPEIPPGDVFALDPLWVPELVKRETIEDPQVPFLSFINVLYYNIDILKEAGFSRPPKNRTEFFNYAKAAADKEKNRWGLCVGKNSPRGIYDDVYPWIWAAGARLIEDGKPVVASRPLVDTLSFLAALSKEGLIAPENTGGKLETFVSGRAAFMIAPVNAVSFVGERMKDKTFDITSVPVPDNYAGKTFSGSAAWTAGINPASAHREEARLFAAFLAGKAAFLAEKAGAIPGSAASPPFYSKAWDIAMAGENAQDFSGLSGEHRMEELFREELSVLFAETTDAAGAAAAIQKKWEALLKEE